MTLLRPKGEGGTNGSLSEGAWQSAMSLRSVAIKGLDRSPQSFESLVIELLQKG